MTAAVSTGPAPLARAIAEAQAADAVMWAARPGRWAQVRAAQARRAARAWSALADEAESDEERAA